MTTAHAALLISRLARGRLKAAVLMVLMMMAMVPLTVQIPIVSWTQLVLGLVESLIVQMALMTMAMVPSTVLTYWIVFQIRHV